MTTRTLLHQTYAEAPSNTFTDDPASTDTPIEYQVVQCAQCPHPLAAHGWLGRVQCGCLPQVRQGEE